MKIRLWPTVRYVNFRKVYPAEDGIWRQWFMVRRYWLGRLIYVSVRHHYVILDFRRDWVADLIAHSRGEAP